MRALTSNDGGLMSYFDKIDETEAENNNTTIKHSLINNHTGAANEANKGKIVGQLPLEHVFGFCKTFKKIRKD